MKKMFASLKSLKKGVENGVGSGFISQRSGSAPKCHGSSTLASRLQKFIKKGYDTVYINSFGRADCLTPVCLSEILKTIDAFKKVSAD
jgi:hypothetical protein